jgi:polysaccharide biosynthesis/export protein
MPYKLSKEYTSMPVRKLAKQFMFTAALSLILTSCAGTPKLGGAPGLTVIDASQLPAPTKADLTGQEHDYYVGPFDRLTIDVFGIEEMSKRDVQVDAGGRISFPLAGVIPVSGKTAGEIEELLKERLRQAYIRDPQVTVNLKDTLSQYVTVEGTVQKPGLYPVIGHMTLLRAIATAQGTTEFSKVDDVVILRTVAGKQYAALYNLNSVRHGAYADPEIYPNDVVMVGDNHARRLFKDYLTGITAISSPLIILLSRI